MEAHPIRPGHPGPEILVPQKFMSGSLIVAGLVLLALGSVALSGPHGRMSQWAKWIPGVMLGGGSALLLGGMIGCCYWRPAVGHAQGRAQGPQGPELDDQAVALQEQDLSLNERGQRQADAWLRQLHQRQPVARPETMLEEHMAAANECTRWADIDEPGIAHFREALSRRLAARYCEAY